MSQILVDMGNSRCKFVRLSEGVITSLVAIDNASLFRDPFLATLSDDINEVWISSVVSAEYSEQLIQYFNKHITSSVHIVKVEDACCGFTNGYKDIKALGVDRWLAMIGATNYASNYIVVSAGTAVTIDVVFNKKHQGGYIVPSIQLQIESLHSSTARLQKVGVNSKNSISLGVSTQDCIQNGALLMLISTINRVVNDSQQQFECDFMVLGSGGGFSQIQPLLDVNSLECPLLIFEGMKKMIESENKVLTRKP